MQGDVVDSSLDRQKNKREITTAKSSEISFLTKILFIQKYKGLRNEEIYREIPKRLGVRSRGVFETLMILYGLVDGTEYDVKKATQWDNRPITRCIEYLMELKYIRMVGKPRLIIPFQAYKVDKGYRVTVQGERVLRKLLGEK